MIVNDVFHRLAPDPDIPSKLSILMKYSGQALPAFILRDPWSDRLLPMHLTF